MNVKNDLIEVARRHENGDLYNEIIRKIMIEDLPRSHLFTVHADLVDEHVDFGQSLFEKRLARMPFEFTLVHLRQSNGHHGCCLIHQSEDEYSLAGIPFSPTQHYGWQPMAWCYMPDPVAFITHANDEFIKNAAASPRRAAGTSPLQRIDLTQEETDLCSSWGGYWAEVALAVLSLLISKDAAITENKAPDRLNKRRERAGKPPIEQSTTVIVKAQNIRTHTGENSNRMPPRMHWRRGHIRTMGNGKIVPVAPTIVGASGSPIIKNYLFRN